MTLVHTFASVGVIKIPTEGLFASLAARHPTTAPPPITPTTMSGSIFLHNLAVSIAALPVFKLALKRVFLVAACPPACGMLVLCHSIPFFLKSKPGAVWSSANSH